MRSLTAGRGAGAGVAAPRSRGTSRRPMRAAVAAVLVLAGACGGGDGGARREAGGATTTTTTTTTNAAATPAGGGATTPTSARYSTAATAARGSAAPATTTTTTKPRAAPAPGPAFTAPGTYRYATTGRFTTALTGAQPRDGEATLTVDPPSGTDQRSVRRGPGRTTEQVLRLDGAGAHLVSLRLTDQGVDKEVRPSPPGLVLPADAAPGRTWAWRATSTDGLTAVDSSFRAVRTEDVTVGGERVPTLVVEVVLTLAGDVVSTSRQTLWVSTARRLVVRQDEATDGRFGLVTFSATSSDTLISLAPA